MAPSAPPPPAAATPPPAAPDPPAPEAPAAAPEPAATVEPPAEPAAAAPASPDAEAANPVPVWTDVQDAMLLGLKAIGKTWKEIGALVEGKDTEDLRERYDEITAAKPAEKKEKKGEAAKDEGQTTDATEEESEAKKGKKNKNEKNKNKNKKKDDQGDAVSQEESDDVAEEATTKKDKKNKNKQPRGILKPDDASQTSDDSTTAAPDDDLPRFYNGHPIIYIDPADGLTPNEVSPPRPQYHTHVYEPILTPLLPKTQLQNLFKMYQHIEQNKWLQMASRLFDKTGKRVSPDLLREKFENLSPY